MICRRTRCSREGRQIVDFAVIGQSSLRQRLGTGIVMMVFVDKVPK